MRRLGWWLPIALAVTLAVPLAGCERETAIVVEVDWQLPTVRAADTLHIYVGTPSDDVAAFLTNPGTIAIPLADAPSPFRYLLRPSDDVDAIGELQLAAAITEGDSNIGFAPAAEQVRFADGEIRTVQLAPIARRFEISGDRDQCVTWSADGDGALDRSIGVAGDNDCDLRDNLDDCQPFNPRITGANLDGDGATCDDCFDGDAPMVLGGWRIEPSSVFPGQTEAGFRIANQLPGNVECLHIDYDCSGDCGVGRKGTPDGDGSNSDACGSIKLGAAFLTCPPAPSDCDEDTPGHTPMYGDPEVCDGADQSCDERPSPHLPCVLPGPMTCLIGQQDCHDAFGRFGACAPSGFAHELDAETCAIMDRLEGCRFTDDPLQCTAGDREECILGRGPGCFDEQLPLPGIPGQTGCDWRIVGGVDHAEWVIGFVRSSDPNAPPVAATDECGPFLVARAVHANPTPRTVMVLTRSSVGAIVAARFITFEATNDSAACDRQLACTTLN